MAELPRQRRTIPAWPIILLALGAGYWSGREHGWGMGYCIGIARGIDTLDRVQRGLPL